MTWASRFSAWLCLALVLVFAGATRGDCEVTKQLSQIKTLYVDSFGMDQGAAEMRKQLIRRLQKSGDVQVVSNPKDADAVIRGNGRTWVTGYMSLSPRSHSLNQPSFSGFLSVELVDKNDATLWSYLVTPSSLPWNGIADDLARQLVTKLVASIKVTSVKGEARPGSTGAGSHAEGTLRGAGATFPAPLYQRWFELFQEQYPKVQISYDAVGSAEGLQRLKEGKVDFGASEMPLSDQAMSAAHEYFQHVPAVLGAVVVIYNVKGVHQTLNFTAETLSGIFLGKISKWNDPQIRKSNRGVALPDAEIAVVHRSDGSGTSFVWTDYLSKVSPQWKASVGHGATVAWLVGTGAEGNEGVASSVKQTPNSIGYVEFIYAIQHELSFGAVRNAAGAFIKADISSVTAAAAAATTAEKRDFRVSITNSPGKAAYPIATYTWLLLPDQLKDKSEEKNNKETILRELLRWVLTSGQKQCSALGYAPLPAEVAKRALEAVDLPK